MSFVIALLFLVTVWAAIIIANERFGILRCDDFPSTGAKLFAYAWLGIFLIGIGLLVTASSQHAPTAAQLARTPFYALFQLQAILAIFLLGWWLATRRPPLRTFLNIQREHTGEAVMTGLAIGLGGWILTIIIAIMIGLVATAAGVHMPKDPPVMIAYLAHVAWWKKMLIVMSAMTVEEAMFRGFLQKRLGLLASTVLFAMAHIGFGQPLLLVGVATISLIIGFTFYRTKNLIPGVVAHGVFDAVQLFVIIPIAFRMLGV